MNSISAAPRNRAWLSLLGLAGLLIATTTPAEAQQATSGQASDSTPMTLIVAVYPDAALAGQAMRQLSSDQKAQVQSFAVVSKDAKGKVKVRDRKSRKGARGDRAHKSIDGAVALLGQSPQQSAGDSTGAEKAGMSQSDANKVRAMVPTDNSAILVVVPADDASPMNAALEQSHPTQVMGAELVPVP